MDYENERWLKIYTRDTGGWLDLSWQARGLALEISRKLDAEGKLPLGKKGLASLAGVLRGRWEDMKPFVEELIADERLTLLEGNVLLEPGYVERQTARSSAAYRKKEQRFRDAASRDVTRSHTASQDVTRGHETSRIDQRRSEETRSEEKIFRIAPAEPTPPPAKRPMAPVVEPIVPAPRRRKPEMPCPESDAAPLVVEAWAADWKIPQAHAEFAGFLEHHRKNDARFRDWSAAWRTWLRNAPKFAPRSLFAPRHVQSGDNRAWKIPSEMP